MRPAYDHTGDSAPVKPRPLRADARRNRERILAAATAAFAADGLSVPLDEIARRAGVGPGTLYRHFPAKEALWEAVLHSRLERLADEAEALAGLAIPRAANPSAASPRPPAPPTPAATPADPSTPDPSTPDPAPRTPAKPCWASSTGWSPRPRPSGTWPTRCPARVPT